MRREGRLGRVALLALTAGHPRRADPRAQGRLGAGGEVVDGAGEVLQRRERGMFHRRSWRSVRNVQPQSKTLQRFRHKDISVFVAVQETLQSFCLTATT